MTDDRPRQSLLLGHWKKDSEPSYEGPRKALKVCRRIADLAVVCLVFVLLTRCWLDSGGEASTGDASTIETAGQFFAGLHIVLHVITYSIIVYLLGCAIWINRERIVHTAKCIWDEFKKML